MPGTVVRQDAPVMVLLHPGPGGRFFPGTPAPDIPHLLPEHVFLSPGTGRTAGAGTGYDDKPVNCQQAGSGHCVVIKTGEGDCQTTARPPALALPGA